METRLVNSLPMRIGFLLRPFSLRTLPWSYPWLWRVFQKAAATAQIGKLATHTMRHTYRRWLDAVGTGIAVQQKLMRHSDIRTTLNVYGDVITERWPKRTQR